jgi:nucleoside-diphosphate-sugar epimerase
MRYLVAGATSGTGNVVARLLRDKLGAENLVCLVRSTSDTAPLEALGLRLHVGDVTEPETYVSLMGPSTIYLDMTHPKHYHRSLNAVVQAGVERAYFVTTTGIFSRYNQFSEIYKINEEKIRRSGIVYTLLRPSMIYGSARDKNMNRLIRFLARSPVFPLFGHGRAMMQPVYVEDLSQGIVAALGETRTENQEYNLAGPEGIPYARIVETILSHLGRNVLRIPIDTRLAAGIARYAQHLPGFPVTEEQVLRLLEDKVFDISRATRDLDYRPRSFDAGIGAEIADLRAARLIR